MLVWNSASRLRALGPAPAERASTSSCEGKNMSELDVKMASVNLDFDLYVKTLLTSFGNYFRVTGKPEIMSPLLCRAPLREWKQSNSQSKGRTTLVRVNDPSSES